MPPSKNRATARFFGCQKPKKGPSRSDAFWEMPPPTGETRTGVNEKMEKF